MYGAAGSVRAAIKSNRRATVTEITALSGGADTHKTR